MPNLFPCLNQVTWGNPGCLPRRILPGSYSINYFLSDLSLVFLLSLSLIPLNLLSWSKPRFVHMSFCLFVCFSCMLTLFSHAQLFVILWTVACQVPLSMGFSRQEYWGGLLFPPPGHLPNPGMHSMSVVAPALKADSLPLSHHFPSRDVSRPPFSFTITVSAMCLIPHVWKGLFQSSKRGLGIHFKASSSNILKFFELAYISLF